MGGGKGKSSGGFTPQVPPPTENYPAYKAGVIGENMWDMTAPVRGYITSDWDKFFNPEQGRRYDPSQLPAFSPLYNMARTGMEDQYGVAKENILSNMPRGGAMGRAMGNLETGRARDVGSLQSAISAPLIKDIYDKAHNTGFVTGPATALAGLGLHAADTRSSMTTQLQAQMQAQAIMAQQEAANAQASSAKGGGVGSMLGKGLGSVGGTIFGPLGTAIGGSLGGLAGGGGKGGGGFGGAGMTTGGLGQFSGATSFLGG